MSGYLALAKKATKEAPRSAELMVAEEERKLEGARKRGLMIRWSEYPTWIKLHDPATGDWHEVRASECLPGVVETANKHRKKEGTAQ